MQAVREKKFNKALAFVILAVVIFWVIVYLIVGCSSNPSKEADEYYESIDSTTNYEDEIDSLYNFYYQEKDSTDS